MRHFSHLPAGVLGRLFLLPPGTVDPAGDRETLATALGATLYTPSTRPTLGADVARLAATGLTSLVVCLEDAVDDDDVRAAEANVVAELRGLAATDEAPRLRLFLRPRRPEQVGRLLRRLGRAEVLVTGFVLPKFDDISGPDLLEAVVDAALRLGRRLYALPVLETPAVAHAERRVETLVAVARLLDKHRDSVLAVRVGAADLAGVFGLRREPLLSAYDIGVVRDTIAAVVNVLGRADGSGFVVSGPVWEQLPRRPGLPVRGLAAGPLRWLPGAGVLRRQALLPADLAPLLREVRLDKANGLLGKTVIHPRHVGAVNAALVVTHEEYADAQALQSAPGSGARRSAYGTRMNEGGPHRAWAAATLLRAQVYGVARPGVRLAEIVAAAVR